MKPLHVDIVIPKKSPYAIDVPETIPKMHQLVLFSARRNSGKTLAASSWLQMLKREKIIDEIILITPTWNSNRSTWEPLNLKEENVLEPTKDVVEKVKKMIIDQKDEWDAFVENKKKR